MASLTFKISAELEAAGFKQAADHMRSLDNETKKLKTSTKEQEGGVTLLKTAYGALLGLGIVEFFKASLDASAEAKEQQIQLAGRVEQTGLNYANAKPKLDAFFEALQNQSGIAKDKLIPAFDFLVDKTNSVRASQELMTTAMGLARARGLQLSEAADLVAGAYNGQQRSLAILSKTLGLTSEQAKDNDLVISKLKDRYAGLATQTDSAAIAQARLKNSINDLQEKVGDFAAGPVTLAAEGLRKFLIMLQAGLEDNAVRVNHWVQIVRLNVELIPAIFNKGWSKAVEDTQNQLNILGKITNDELKAITDRMNEQLNPKQQAGDSLVEATLGRTRKLKQDELVIIAEGNAAIAKNDADSVAARLALIDAQIADGQDKLRSSNEFELLSAQDQQALLTSVEQRGASARAKIYEQEAKAKIDIFMKSGIAIGDALGKALSGQQDAWKSALSNIIGMVAQQVQAIITANTARDVSFLPGGLANPAAWGLIAQGTAQVALVAGVASAAQAAIGGGGGSGGSTVSAGGGGGSAAASGGPAPTAVTPAASNTLTIYVQGDVVDSDAFMNSLAAKLSSKVENQDIRLVASTVRA